MGDRTTNKTTHGEIAPIPWFGSETLEEAISFCQQQGDIISETAILEIPDNLPACQFAFATALEAMQSDSEIDFTALDYCHLLPTGELALATDFSNFTKGDRNTTFKWKIGVAKPELEINLLQKLLTKLPLGSQIRLDANGGLTLQQARQWLKFAETKPQIEFIEQPLKPAYFAEMMALQREFKVTLALDESVANITQLIDCYRRGWRGVFVVKAAIAGYPHKLRQFCQQHDLDLVFSSVFATDIGRQAALRLALELGNRDRAVGFGTKHWFAE